MTPRLSSLVGLTAALGFIGAPSLSPAISLVPMEEPQTQLVAPNASVSAFGYGSQTATMVTSTPLICTNTSAPLNPIPAINPVYYSPFGASRLPPLPFVFGASPVSPSVPTIGYGATDIELSGNSIRVLGDPSLVCYGLGASGARRVTAGVFRDKFEGALFDPTLQLQYNSALTLSVFHVPANSSDFYGYSIDVTIPPLPAIVVCGSTFDCNFALLEGFDTSVFATGAGGWCLANAGALSCPGALTLGGIIINYANFGGALPNLTAPIAPAAAKTFHFVVFRYFRSGVTSLPTSGVPVAIAALFSPFDLDENKLDDNVAAGGS
jgi:hypothetical protein